MRMQKIIFIASAAAALLLSILFSGGAVGQTSGGENEAERGLAAHAPHLEESSPIPSITEDTHAYYLPMMLSPQRPAPLEILSVYTASSNGNPYGAFIPNSGINFTVQATNTYSSPIAVNIRWRLTGPCGDVSLEQETVTAPPGIWYHPISSTTGDCLGIYTASVEIEYLGQSQTYTEEGFTYYVVSDSTSATVLSDKHGFDRGRLPTITQMQTWWNSSPYWIYNLYLGGASLYYKNEPLDAAWVYEVANQGWSFTLTWVGPQAPCTTYQNRLPNDRDLAEILGRSEAAAAISAAEELGITGDKIIYYDMEFYSRTNELCNSVVKAFFEGWTDQLHLEEYKSGGYGNSCNMREWATTALPPDYIWFAYYSSPGYNPNEHVFWTYYPCPLDNVWMDQQRIKQYAGDHLEEWGAIALVIDSNVFDSPVTALPYSENPTVRQASQASLLVSTPAIRDFQLISPPSGWTWLENQVYWTGDGGNSWQVLDFGLEDEVEILGVAFRDAQEGTVVVRSLKPDAEAPLFLLHTHDQGVSWEVQPLGITDSLEAAQISAAYPEFISDRIGFISLKIRTSSAFNEGRLLATQDGGQTWEERSLPVGEPVYFVDAAQGWILPEGEETPRLVTEDGGRTWHPFEDYLQLPSAVQQLESSAALPAGTLTNQWANPQVGWALVQEGNCEGEKLSQGSVSETPFVCYQSSSLMATMDQGSSWQEITPDTNTP